MKSGPEVGLRTALVRSKRLGDLIFIEEEHKRGKIWALWCFWSLDSGQSLGCGIPDFPVAIVFEFLDPGNGSRGSRPELTQRLDRRGPRERGLGIKDRQQGRNGLV